MGTTTPESNSNDSASQRARAFTLGMQFGQAQYAQDWATMRVALVNMINLRHNTTGDQTTDATNVTHDLVRYFTLGVEFVGTLKWIDVALVAMSVQFFNSVAECIPSLFGIGSTDACVDGGASGTVSPED